MKQFGRYQYLLTKEKAVASTVTTAQQTVVGSRIYHSDKNSTLILSFSVKLLFQICEVGYVEWIVLMNLSCIRSGSVLCLHIGISVGADFIYVSIRSKYRMDSALASKGHRKIIPPHEIKQPTVGFIKPDFDPTHSLVILCP